MNPSPQDDPLRRVLLKWQPQPTANPSFRADVWARIGATGAHPLTWWTWLRSHLLPVTGLAAASAACAVFAGVFFAQVQAEQRREALLHSYLVSIDPHQQIAANSR